MSAAGDTIPATLVIPVEDIQTRTLVAGVAITSFAALLVELALTRLFSVVLFYPSSFRSTGTVVG